MRGRSGALGLKPELHWTRLIRVQTPISFVSIRVHSWFKKHPSIRVNSWFKKHPPFVSIRGSKQRNPGGPSPLTPGPSPLPGARGAVRGRSGDLGLKPDLQ